MSLPARQRSSGRLTSSWASSPAASSSTGATRRLVRAVPAGSGRSRQHAAVVLQGTQALGGTNPSWYQTPFSSRTLIRRIGRRDMNFTLPSLSC